MCKTPPTKEYTCNCNSVTVHLWEHCGNKCVWESSLCLHIWHHMTSFYSLSTFELIACHMTSHIILHCPYSCELIVCHMTSHDIILHCPYSCELYRVSHTNTGLQTLLLEWSLCSVSRFYRLMEPTFGVKSVHGATPWSSCCQWVNLCYVMCTFDL